MTVMRALGVVLGGAVGAASMGAAAHAEASYSGNVALTSDYVFRGQSRSDDNPAIQGGFDYANGAFYAGAWGSSVEIADDGSLELDVYAGARPTFGSATLEFGAFGYFFPGVDEALDADYIELKAAGKVALSEPLKIGAALYWSPDFGFTPGEEVQAFYYEGNASYAATGHLTFSGAIGHQDADDPIFLDGASFVDGYTTWNVGATASAYGFSLDIRYVGADLDNELAGDRVVATLSRVL